MLNRGKQSDANRAVREAGENKGTENTAAEEGLFHACPVSTIGVGLFCFLCLFPG